MVRGELMGSVLTVDDVAALLKIDAKTVRQYARTQMIPAFKLGNQWRFWVPALERWLSREYPGFEQEPAGVVTTLEDEGCRYLNEVRSTGSIFGTKDKEYEDLLKL